MELSMLAALLEKHLLSEPNAKRIVHQRLLDRGLIQYSCAKKGWIPTRLGERLLESASYLVERAGKRDNYDLE